MEKELNGLQEKMGSAEFYRMPPEEIRRVNERVAALPELIEQAYTQWADLDARR